MKKKLMFAIVNDTVLIAMGKWKNVSGREWIVDGLGCNSAEYETIVRGAVFEKCVTFVVGSKCYKADIDDLPEGAFNLIVSIACGVNSSSTIDVWNGQHIGSVGELWPPIEDLGTFMPNEI